MRNQSDTHSNTNKMKESRIFSCNRLTSPSCRVWWHNKSLSICDHSLQCKHELITGAEMDSYGHCQAVRDKRYVEPYGSDYTDHFGSMVFEHQEYHDA